MRVRFVLLVWVVAAGLSGMAGAQTAMSQPAARSLQQCTDLMLQSVARAEGLLPEMARAADVVAKRWIEGADIFAGGDESFTDEAFYRAGGLIGLRRIAQVKQNFNGRQMRWEDVPEESIVLYGLHRSVDPSINLFDELGHLAYERNTVVFFGSSRWPISQKIVKLLQSRLPGDKVFFIDTQLPMDTRLVASDGTRYGDYAGMSTAVYQWAFTAELVAACTRQGKMPGIWPSGQIPRYEVWEKKYENIKFHDDLRVPPIEAGVLGRQYLEILRAQLQACRDSAPEVRAAARLLSNMPADKAVYVMVESHLLAGEAWLPVELPNWVLAQRGYRWRRAAPTVEKGDAIVWLGYIEWPNGEVRRAVQQQTPFVGVSVRAPGERVKDEPLYVPEEKATSTRPAIVREPAGAIKSHPRTPATLPAGVLWVPAPWQYPDAVVQIPDYPLPACPTSGIVQGTLLWGVVGETVEARGKAAAETAADISSQ